MVHATARGRSTGIAKVGGSFPTGASDPVEKKSNRLKTRKSKTLFL